jgi:conjugal transfer mating pair stabilization protein TraN
MEFTSTGDIDAQSGNYLTPPSYTFASTNSAVTQQNFLTTAATYGAHPANLTYKDFIIQHYGNGPFWIEHGALYTDVFFNTESCPAYQDFSNRTWQPKDFASQSCANFPKSWEKIETACLCTQYTEDIYQRVCSTVAPFYTESFLNTITINSDMSTCSGNPLFCKAGLSQQGLNDCSADQTTYTDFVTCSGQSIQKTRTVRRCRASATVTVPTEYRTIPDNLFGIMQWDTVKCHPCISPQDNVVADDVPSGPDTVIDETKQCTNFKMFSGSDKRCRPSGFGTIFTNCCSMTGWFTTWCNNEERELKKKKESSVCHEVGSYCSSRVKFLGICLQKKKSYCCYNSIISRIINEQGRAQISKPWGPAKTPDCHGFTPDDFSKLDFSTIDLSEYSDNIQSNTSSAPGEVMKGINNWMQTQQNKPFLNK